MRLNQRSHRVRVSNPVEDVRVERQVSFVRRARLRRIGTYDKNHVRTKNRNSRTRRILLIRRPW